MIPEIQERSRTETEPGETVTGREIVTEIGTGTGEGTPGTETEMAGTERGTERGIGIATEVGTERSNEAGAGRERGGRGTKNERDTETGTGMEAEIAAVKGAEAEKEPEEVVNNDVAPAGSLCLHYPSLANLM